jgi:hypothetical protein
MSEHFIPLPEGAQGTEGVLLAINPSNITRIESVWMQNLEEHQLRIHTLDGRFIRVSEADAGATLEALGLGELVEDFQEDDLTEDE